MIKKKNVLYICVFTILAVPFLLFPIYSLFVKGVFSWHISVSMFWKDVYELLFYLAGIILFSCFSPKKKGIFVLIASVLYLSSTGTLTQCLVSYFYIEILILIGESFLSLYRKDRKSYSTGVNFLAGSIVWGSFAIIMSLIGIGGVAYLRILTVMLFLLAVVNPKKSISLDGILLVRYVRYINSIQWVEFIANLYFVFVMLISCARVNTFIESDSSWYALHTDKCLFGEHSFYDYLGYTTFVHYYPKFKELLMAPLTGLGLAGYLISVNLWIMIICAVEVYDFLRESIMENQIQILCIVFLIFSSVCIIGISSTAKSDTLCYLYTLMCIFYFIKFLKNENQDFLGIALSAGIMSYTVKYTAFLFSTLMLFIILVQLMYLLLFKRVRLKSHNAICNTLVISACFIFMCIMYRTYKLTGYPTYREGKSVWDTLGLQAKLYFNVDASYKPGHVFEPFRIVSVLFDVGNAGKITAQWTGNYSIFLGICLLVLFRHRLKNTNKFLFTIASSFIAVSVYFLIIMAAPDGNYFSVAIVIATCYIFIRITESDNWKNYKSWFTATMGMFMLLNLIFVFTTHPSWGTATRFSEDTIKIYMSEEDKITKKYDYMKLLDIYSINEDLKTVGGKLQILADGPTAMCMLDARVETVRYVFDRYLSGAYINDYQDFLQYINYVGTGGFIVARDGSGLPEFGNYVEQYIAEYGYVNQITTENYKYYRIK